MTQPEENAFDGDNNGDEFQEADPEDVARYQPEDSAEEPSSEEENSEKKVTHMNQRTHQRNVVP